MGVELSLSQNRGTDQLRGYRVSDVRLCFLINAGFLVTSYILSQPYNATLFLFDYFYVYEPPNQNFIQSGIYHILVLAVCLKLA